MRFFLGLSTFVASIGSSISCPDGKLSCPNAFTCCLLPSGEYGCCPYPKVHINAVDVPTVSSVFHIFVAELNLSLGCSSSLQAVCCEDHLHCCPHGTICNLKSSTCDDSTGNAVTPINNRCDKSTTCPGKSTCCKTASGGWACCPLRQAVCCDDHIHCCPHGKVCNLVAALTLEVEDEKCDEKTRCPWGSTCCKMNSGQWACCPLPQAVCCNDHEHCCPKGYKCNVAEGTCDKPGGLSVAWLQKIPALQEELGRTVSHPTQNMCDAQTSCPRDTTCCFMEKEHKWGCCPVPNAVCCKDGNHCCPSGHTCEPHHFSCSKGSHVIPWFTKVSAVTEPGAVIDVKCDNKSSCASGTTCCKLKTGKWGCCPLFKAVCCFGSKHCCPAGYSCDLKAGGCTLQTQLTWDSWFGDQKRDTVPHGL
uniref:Granulin b n=1 Tax=Neolamprologus brichardi TaxID=32507 RepID=A0A3Q4NAW1_NEOBR